MNLFSLYGVLKILKYLRKYFIPFKSNIFHFIRKLAFYHIYIVGPWRGLHSERQVGESKKIQCKNLLPFLKGMGDKDYIILYRKKPFELMIFQPLSYVAGSEIRISYGSGSSGNSKLGSGYATLQQTLLLKNHGVGSHFTLCIHGAEYTS